VTAEREIMLTFPSGARVGLPQDDAAWLRDELLSGRFRPLKRDAGLTVDRALAALHNTESAPAAMTRPDVIELVWALRGMLEHDSDRFQGSPLLMHLRDLLFVEAVQGD
jgi:hypothetical protein